MINEKIEELFTYDSEEEILQACIDWFSEGKKSREEIEEWIRGAYKSAVLKANPFLPIALLYFSSKRYVSKNLLQKYMEVIVECCKSENPLEGDPIAYVENETNFTEFSEEGAEIARMFRAAIQNVVVEKEKERKALSLKKWSSISLKCAALLLVAGLSFAGGKAYGERKFLVTEEKDIELSSEEGQEHKDEAPAYAIASKRDKIRVRTAPSNGKEGIVVAMLSGDAALRIQIGSTFLDPETNWVWRSVNMDEYIGVETEGLEVLKPKEWSEGRIYYIYDNYLEKEE